MESIYFTIAGTKHHYGQEYFGPGMEVKYVLPQGVLCELSGAEDCEAQSDLL